MSPTKYYLQNNLWPTFHTFETTIANRYTFCKTSLPHVSINKGRKMLVMPFQKNEKKNIGCDGSILHRIGYQGII
jgi:hypothetical protein